MYDSSLYGNADRVVSVYDSSINGNSDRRSSVYDRVYIYIYI